MKAKEDLPDVNARGWTWRFRQRTGYRWAVRIGWIGLAASVFFSTQYPNTSELEAVSGVPREVRWATRSMVSKYGVPLGETSTHTLVVVFTDGFQAVLSQARMLPTGPRVTWETVEAALRDAVQNRATLRVWVKKRHAQASEIWQIAQGEGTLLAYEDVAFCDKTLAHALGYLGIGSLLLAALLAVQARIDSGR